MTETTAPALRPFATCIDEQLATLHTAIRTAADERHALASSIFHAAGARQSRHYGWTLKGETIYFAGARAIAEAAIAAGEYLLNGSSVAYLATALERHDAATATIEAARAATAELEAVAAAEGWSRFFTVPDGHIHATTSCHTLRPTTRIGWHPELSGLLEADAVAAFGPTLCTVCFPSAPVEHTRGLPPTVKPGQCPGALKPATAVRTTYGYRSSARYGTCSTCAGQVKVKTDGHPHGHKPAKV